MRILTPDPSPKERGEVLWIYFSLLLIFRLFIKPLLWRGWGGFLVLLQLFFLLLLYLFLCFPKAPPLEELWRIFFLLPPEFLFQSVFRGLFHVAFSLFLPL